MPQANEISFTDPEGVHHGSGDISSTRYERRYLDEANKSGEHKLHYFDVSLEMDTVGLAAGYGAVCIFVNDKADAQVLDAPRTGGTRLLALRCTGFNNVDLEAAARLGIKVVRVVTYSPNSVAEHAVALLLAINRKVHRAYNRTRDSNFSLDGLTGFDLSGKTVAVVGTGKIGCVFAKIMLGFGCRVIGFDLQPSTEFEALGLTYAKQGEIGEKADIISLHCLLTPTTHHVINSETLKRAKPGAILINTSRGGLLDTQAAIDALKTGQLMWLLQANISRRTSGKGAQGACEEFRHGISEEKRCFPSYRPTFDVGYNKKSLHRRRDQLLKMLD
ncbi:D-lactate dehydrogenase [Paraburkholderia sp. BL6665CI2N2]|uniref:2-hydroxyacid dehydrogenase n=1 Tax=Paraburkholderia sp. BL6665CI2N2 TaxID=1938806 RepID=UPI0010DC1275|nr:2-hydroxyacid dehydrogenase [Paraburkholderia sp. BL6665CI2N2]TDY20019.1 D-lactate dehydrogenase [Paraburkholderia sp. BL6665CI2N2]